MNNRDELELLSDDELLHRVSDLLAQSRRVEWVLVAHIAEVDARRLYAREAWPSMIQYCMGPLHLSEGEAYRRIAAARLSRRYPVILPMLEDGHLHLCGIGVLSKPPTVEPVAKARYYMAELDDGKEKMDPYRRSADRVSEPQTTLELCPGTIAQNSTATQSSAMIH